MDMRLQHPDLVRDPDVRRMIGAAVGPASAVGCEQAVQLGDHRTLRPARLEGEREVIERAIEIEGRRQFLVGHPEDSVGAIVRQGGAGPRLEDEFRRQHDARDAECPGAGR